MVTRLRAALPDPDPDRDHVTALLADVYWERPWLRRYARPGDPAGARAEVRRLVAAIGALAVSDQCPDLATYRQVLLGLSSEWDAGSRSEFENPQQRRAGSGAGQAAARARRP